VLFLALFASQAGVLVLSPILSDIAAEFGISIAEAGQLRILAAPLAALVALAAGRSLARFSPRALLVTGSALLAIGSVASTVAPTFVLLALAQVPMWMGVAILVAAGVAATAAWSKPERRTKVVAHALAGAPSAWIVGMPLIGLVAEIHWRLAFLALPLPAAVLAGLAVLGRPPDAPIAGARASLAGLMGRVGARRWALGELLSSSAWAGTLVFSGALFTEVHGTSPTVTGIALAFVAAAFLAGNQWASRSDLSQARRKMLGGSVAAGIGVALTWWITPTVAVTLALFGITAFVAATRVVSGTVYGFTVAGDLGREVGAIRAATQQLGYLIGALVGGLALAVGGFDALAVSFGGLFLVSTLPYVCLRPACRLRLAAGTA
jgi:predicted MFS family arabinose efflux permease